MPKLATDSIPPDPFLVAEHDQIVSLALRHGHDNQSAPSRSDRDIDAFFSTLVLRRAQHF
jgi:hypothetical protein